MGVRATPPLGPTTYIPFDAPYIRYKNIYGLEVGISTFFNIISNFLFHGALGKNNHVACITFDSS